MTTLHDDAQLIAYTRPVADVMPLEFLRQFNGQTRVFWQRGQYSTAYAGAGAALLLHGDGPERFATLRANIETVFERMLTDSNAPSDIRPRFFGGFAFDNASITDPLWSNFGSAAMLLPRYTLTRAGGYSWLTVCDYGRDAAADRMARIRHEFDTLCAQFGRVAQPASSPEALAVREVLDTATWRMMVEQGVGLIHDGALRKIVLARALDVDFSGPVAPVSVLGRLEAGYPTAFRFLFEFAPGSAFFGATPELLTRLEGGWLHTHALAGSAPRGTTPEEDDRIAEALLKSPKDLHEHALVVNWLRAALQPLSRTLDVPSLPTVTRLKNIQHLFTPVQAQLRERVHLLRVIEQLHPTPALGGDPQREAAERLRHIEPFERGWYAGPVGWVDGAGDGEFAVAIRSAVASGSHVRLYAGAGIVGDSQAEREWEETGVKFRPMLDALDIPYDARVMTMSQPVNAVRRSAAQPLGVPGGD